LIRTAVIAMSTPDAAALPSWRSSMLAPSLVSSCWVLGLVVSAVGRRLVVTIG